MQAAEGKACGHSAAGACAALAAISAGDCSGYDRPEDAEHDEHQEQTSGATTPHALFYSTGGIEACPISILRMTCSRSQTLVEDRP